MTENKQYQNYIAIIKRVVKPALGCTEPIAAAYAAAVAVKELGGRTPHMLDVVVSNNLFKNAMGVFVPGTGQVGLPIAAAAGAIGGNPNSELQVLENLSAEAIVQAQEMIAAGRVHIQRQDSDDFIYCSVTAQCDDDVSQVVIRGGHTNIVEKSLNGVMTYQQSRVTASDVTDLDHQEPFTIRRIYDFAVNVPFHDIAFILEAARLNMALANEGLSQHYGLAVGRNIKNSIESHILADDLNNRIQMYTSAASDARMGGATLPAMSNYGSGNQGIAATIPAVIAAEYFGVTEEILARALVMSHLVAIYIKSHYPPLSAFCGNTVTSAAMAMALVYLSGGTFEQCCYAIQNVISDSSGMVCDGAKSSCAMKICTSSSVAVRSFLMAKQNSVVSQQGIVAQEVEKTIQNVGLMVTRGMQVTDSTIIEIMSA